MIVAVQYSIGRNNELFRPLSRPTHMVFPSVEGVEDCGPAASARADFAQERATTMPRNIEQEIADWRQELRDLEEALARQDQPLAPRTKAIAQAKVVTLRHQLAGIEEGDGRRSALS